MMRNSSLKFVCKFVYLKVISNNSQFTNVCQKEEILEIPVAHGDGNYFATSDTLKKLEDNNQILFRYCDKNGEINDSSNPNGSILNIAGIINKERNILGMMPHPERVSDLTLGHTDGLKIFKSVLNNFL
jgi:phosphoribosylformylglycinamidine synthase